MFKVYVLKSIKTGKRYIGYTSKTVSKRLDEHNRSCNKWTRSNRPLVLVHEESFCLKMDAIKRENFLKSGQGRKWLDQNIDT